MMNADQTFKVTRYILMNPKHSALKGLHCIFQTFHRVMHSLVPFAPTPTPSELTLILFAIYIYILVYKQASEQVTKVVTGNP